MNKYLPFFSGAVLNPADIKSLFIMLLRANFKKITGDLGLSFFQLLDKKRTDLWRRELKWGVSEAFPFWLCKIQYPHSMSQFCQIVVMSTNTLKNCCFKLPSVSGGHCPASSVQYLLRGLCSTLQIMKFVYLHA